jgi:hypothetical protein
MDTDITDQITGELELVLPDGNSEKLTGRNAPFEMMAVTDTILYFLLPFIIFIGAADFSSGAAKNVLSNGVPRVKYYLAKLILSCAFCICVLLVYIILPVIVGTIKNGLGGALDMDFMGRLLRPFLAQTFLCIAVTCVGVFFVFVTKRTAAVNGAYIAFCILPTMILFIFIQINEKLINLLNYDIVTNIRMFAKIDVAQTKDIIRAFAIGGFYILASTIGGIAVFRKSEIK